VSSEVSCSSRRPRQMAAAPPHAGGTVEVEIDAAAGASRVSSRNDHRAEMASTSVSKRVVAVDVGPTVWHHAGLGSVK